MVQQEMMFQSVEQRSFLKGPIDNQWGNKGSKTYCSPVTVGVKDTCEIINMKKQEKHA